jgi:hypothetical protein
MEFCEEVYLKFNNDIRAAVQKNLYINGYEHFLRFRHLKI